MKNVALALACAVAVGAAAPAAALEVLDNHGTRASGTAAGLSLLTAPPGTALVPAAQFSELPEPEVFAMMLLGLVLIGYRTSRSSEEKFK